LTTWSKLSRPAWEGAAARPAFKARPRQLAARCAAPRRAAPRQGCTALPAPCARSVALPTGAAVVRRTQQRAARGTRGGTRAGGPVGCDRFLDLQCAIRPCTIRIGRDPARSSGKQPLTEVVHPWEAFRGIPLRKASRHRQGEQEQRPPHADQRQIRLGLEGPGYCMCILCVYESRAIGRRRRVAFRNRANRNRRLAPRVFSNGFIAPAGSPDQVAHLQLLPMAAGP
jgi:hypothetical protein